MVKNNAMIGAGIVILLIIAGFIFVSSGSKTSSQSTSVPTTISNVQTTQQYTTTNPQTTVGQTSTPTTVTQKIDRFTLTEKEYSITPSTLNVAAGDLVVINVINAGTTTHTLFVQGSNVVTPPISPGSNATLSFTAPSAGSYSYYCTIDGHEGLGMMGTLIVASH